MRILLRLYTSLCLGQTVCTSLEPIDTIYYFPPYDPEIISLVSWTQYCEEDNITWSELRCECYEKTVNQVVAARETAVPIRYKDLGISYFNEKCKSALEKCRTNCSQISENACAPLLRVPGLKRD